MHQPRGPALSINLPFEHHHRRCRRSASLPPTSLLADTIDGTLFTALSGKTGRYLFQSPKTETNPHVSQFHPTIVSRIMIKSCKQTYDVLFFTFSIQFTSETFVTSRESSACKPSRRTNYPRRRVSPNNIWTQQVNQKRSRLVVACSTKPNARI